MANVEKNDSKKIVMMFFSPLAFKSDNYFDNYSRSVKYDDIVDYSHFKPSSELIRDKIASDTVGAGDVGLYDFEAGVRITKDNDISDIELALRSGTLDKADVQKLQQLYSVAAKDSISEQKEKALLDKERRAQQNRTAALDKELGISSSEGK